jgi:hypothetical protein
MRYDGLTDQELLRKVVAEIELLPHLPFEMDACSALRLVGLLQLACRHPNISKDDLHFTKTVADQVKQIGPAIAELINRGWQQ